MRSSISTRGRAGMGLGGLLLIGITMNPFMENLEFHEEWLFMITHYLLVIAGFLFTFRWIKGSVLLVLPATLLLVLWHVPYFYALAGAFMTFRLMCELSMIAAGLMIGASAQSMSTFTWLGLFLLWMLADTVFSVVLLLQVPAYSNAGYSFSPFPPSQEVGTAVAMWIFMSGIIAITLGNFLRKLLF